MRGVHKWNTHLCTLLRLHSTSTVQSRWHAGMGQVFTFTLLVWWNFVKVRMLHRFRMRYYLHYQYGWTNQIYWHQKHAAFQKLSGFRFQYKWTCQKTKWWQFLNLLPLIKHNWMVYNWECELHTFDRTHAALNQPSVLSPTNEVAGRKSFQSWVSVCQSLHGESPHVKPLWICSNLFTWGFPMFLDPLNIHGPSGTGLTPRHVQTCSYRPHHTV